MKKTVRHLMMILQMVATLRIQSQDRDTRNGLTAIEHEVIDTILDIERSPHE